MSNVASLFSIFAGAIPVNVTFPLDGLRVECADERTHRTGATAIAVVRPSPRRHVRRQPRAYSEASDHRPCGTSLGPRCAIATRPTAIISKKREGGFRKTGEGTRIRECVRLRKPVSWKPPFRRDAHAYFLDANSMAEVRMPIIRRAISNPVKNASGINDCIGSKCRASFGIWNQRLNFSK